jgi:hypothetical protein
LRKTIKRQKGIEFSRALPGSGILNTSITASNHSGALFEEGKKKSLLKKIIKKEKARVEKAGVPGEISETS